jgi:integrase
MYPSNLLLTQKYIPAKIHKCKIWTVEYYVYNPLTGKLHRKVVKCNRVKTLSLRLAYARQLCKEINEKLASGWNPFFEQECSKGLTKLVDALHTFQAEKNRELRSDSVRSYNSFVSVFENWLTKHNQHDMFCISFTKQHALNFLTEMYVNQKLSNRTYNNYIRFYTSLFNWMIEREYCKVNHFVKLSRKKSEEKRREVIPAELRIRIENHLRQNDYPFLCVALLCYGCLIRPKEILQLRAKDICIGEQIIKISAKVSKSHKSRNVAIPDYLLAELKKLELEKVNPEFYAFSEKFKPGKILKTTRDIGHYWSKLRKILDIPKNVSFYSLKDSGITDLLDAGVAAKIVQQHNDRKVRP